VGSSILLFLSLKFRAPQLCVSPPHTQVSDWWEEFVYLRSRNSLMVNSNYYLMVRGEEGTGERAGLEPKFKVGVPG
jgi:hypothetical protein